MANKNWKDEEQEPPPKSSVPANDPRLLPAGEVVVSQEETAAKAPPDKRIHPRRALPPVPDKGLQQTPTEEN
jgi:hypothetical protein